MKSVIKKYRNKFKINTDGFTLVEVLVAFLLLLMVSQMLLLGISFAAKVEKRTEQMESLRRGIGEHLAEQADCIPGTVRLNIGGTYIDTEEQGWLYTGGEEGEQVIDIRILWVEEGDFTGAEKAAEDLPE